MGLLSQIVNEENVTESEEYVSTGSKKYTISGNHVMKINMAKMMESQGGAIGLALELEDEDGIKIYETVWMTTKEKKPYYLTKEGEKKELPGFSQVKGLSYLMTGLWGIPDGETKQVKEYNWNTKKEEFKEREVITQWIGRAVGVCVQVTMEDGFKDASKTFTRISSKHFYDAVTNLFSSEKKAGKTEPEMFAKFASNSENTPVKDERKMSKGDTPDAPVSKESLGF